MRLFRISRRTPPRTGLVAAAAATALLAVASPAAADATASPATAEQGAGVNVTFTITNDHRTSAITKVRLVLPPASPVAEVYPLSVPDWAPLVTNRTLNPPLQSIHGGAPVTETTQDILWTATAGKSIAPGKAADLMVAMGPMPTSEAITFTLQPTYADGSTGPALTPVAVALTAPVAVVEDPTGGDDFSDIVATVGPEDAATGFWTYAGWFVAVLAGAAALIAVLRSRRSAGVAAPVDEAASSDDEPVTEGELETAGKTRVTAWSYRDGP